MRCESKDTSTSSPSRNRSGRGQRKSSSLPSETVEYLKAWMMSPEHIAHPYPTEQEKAQIMVDTGIELKQLTNWFVNNRKRYWKPRVEARIQQQSHVASVVAAAPVPMVALDTQTCHVVVPVSPEAPVKQDVDQVAPGLVHFDLPRTASQNSFVGTDISKVLSRRDSTPSLHLISEGSTSGSASVSISDEGGDAVSYVESTEDYTTESFSRCDDEGSVSVPKTETEQQITGQPSSQVTPPSTPPKKRMVLERLAVTDEQVVSTPRKKYRRVSLETWRDACQAASDVYCESLPTLEEAAKLFGFTN
eukprot:CAMPEP_0170226486 /NCGR_PEP_ID=MMETSP0116_2-20130129/12954_1 /TAXON_ID=400756 /ORGANISM="Durinskia baltica, Strain CSIRO CS-38" /LENGTH=304 /DNA_ID=CAMNT_0010477211 /DNA_START=215 /DNA_END=1129 /DNA_ORIENTATION=+